MTGMLTALAWLAAGLAPMSGGAEGKMIFREDFSGDLRHFWSEGGRRVAIEDGRLLIDADAEPDRGGMCTVWLRLPLSGDLEVNCDVTVLSSETGTNNINFFLFYTMPDGASPEATREKRSMGAYRDYHGLNGYIFTFVNAPENRDSARFRIRRCPGFRLLSDVYAFHNRIGETYRVTLRRQGKKLEIRIDGRTMLSAEDPEPLASGYFGFRTFRTKLVFDHLQIDRL